MRRYQEIALIAGVFVWCSTVLYLYKSQDTLSMTKENQHELERAFSTMEELQKQNLQLHKIVSQLSVLKMGNVSSDEGDKLMKELRSQLKQCQGSKQPVKENLGAIDMSAPTKDHETLKKKIHNGVVELLYSIETELNHLKKSNSHEGDTKDTISRLSQQQRSILIDIEDLDRLNDDWKQTESKALQDLVLKRIEYVQNPKDCSNAKQLLCRLNKGCGFGCQVHHLTYCFMIAYGTERTLIVDSANWRYEPGGWEVVFQPVSKTCTKTSGSPVGWKGEAESKDVQTVLLPIVDGVVKPPPYMPLGIPEDLAPRLFRLHGDPSVWWVGQFMRYLLRPQQWLEEDLEKVEKEFGFENPVVGIQVRRTDKVGTEASFHGIEEYMKHVAEWFDKFDLRLAKEKPGTKSVRRVYLATDEPSVLPEAVEKYPDYVFISDQAISKSAGLDSRYTKASLRGVVLDIFFLSKCDYLVCTFSSQVCRVAYELMQTLHPDASAFFHSLDDIYYYGGQTGHEQRAIYPHHARPGSNEIDLNVGDILGIAGNHWDGYSKGSNRRTGGVGLYPSHKVEEIIKVVKYPTYPEADSEKS